MELELKSTREGATAWQQLRDVERAYGIRPKHRADGPVDGEPLQPTLFARIELAHYLESKGVEGSRLAHLIVPFGRAVAQAYVMEHGEYPPKVHVYVAERAGAARVNYYQGPADLELIERVFRERFTPELDWAEDGAL